MINDVYVLYFGNIFEGCTLFPQTIEYKLKERAKASIAERALRVCIKQKQIL